MIRSSRTRYRAQVDRGVPQEALCGSADELEGEVPQAILRPVLVKVELALPEHLWVVPRQVPPHLLTLSSVQHALHVDGVEVLVAACADPQRPDPGMRHAQSKLVVLQPPPPVVVWVAVYAFKVLWAEGQHPTDESSVRVLRPHRGKVHCMGLWRRPGVHRPHVHGRQEVDIVRDEGAELGEGLLRQLEANVQQLPAVKLPPVF
mmetsp:Transcript_78242/g.253413  ORF Transcript_78242/g.253413 Transcript_78242/m.253413 type:complete len:204 (+) Transcript_78242:294-905(+)